MVRPAAWLACLVLPLAASAADLSLLEGGLRMEIPDEYVPLSTEQVAEMFARGNVPDAAFASADRSVSIAINFSPGGLPPERLEAFMGLVETRLAQEPDLQFIAREMTKAHGREWIHFETTTTHDADPARNRLYITSFRGGMLSLAFNAKRAAYDTHARALDASFRSIRLDD